MRKTNTLSLFITICSLTLSISLQFLNDSGNCWVRAYGRGVGKPISACPEDNPSKSGLLCYPSCRENYTGVGPVCWQDCVSGFRDDGAYCFKPAPYGRKAYTSQSSCEAESGKSCQIWGLLWYPKCGEHFHNVGCCVCSPDCPEGMTDIGISCQKDSYGRGAGVPMVCGPNEFNDAGLCYAEDCKAGFLGLGPVCWGSCPEGYTSCGALCLKEEKCTARIMEYMEAAKKIIVHLASEEYVNAVIDIASLIKDNLYPNCPA